MTQLAPWITYRPEIKVLDATVRDGGLVNNHLFDDEFVRAVYTTCVEAGIDYMEIGYKASKKIFAPDAYGRWKYCDEDDLFRIVGDNDTPLKIAAMADAGKTDWRTDIKPKSESPLDCIRVACYVHQISEAVDMIKDATEKGYEATCNIMAISGVQDAEIDQALEVVRDCPATTVVVVDSFGALYSEQVAMLVQKYQKAMEGTGKEIGIHMHNNQQLAFANTIEGIIRGANRIDATMAGLGRGAGNCCMELLLGFLRNPKFRIRPVWKLIQEHVEPLREKIEWGPYHPYVITGQYNQHPRAAIAWRSGEDRDKIADFYDKIIADI